MSTIFEKTFLDEKELAKYLGVSLSWVRKCRYRNEGVKFKKFGRSVRYQVADIDAYVTSNQTHGG